jgi:3'-phosphoadenosine 5'-phosphosulfate sulfotransferase (PAPS reductase)/FAD synthetase
VSTGLRPRAAVPDLASYDIILVSISGGKDSQTALRLVVTACIAAGIPLHRVVAVFADLGPDDEWPGAPELAAEHAAHYGLRFITVCRTVTDPVTGKRRQQGLLEYIEHHGAWPDKQNRFCTACLKRGPIRTVITALCRELQDAWRAAAGPARARPRKVRVLHVMGMRAQESTDRLLMAPFSHDDGASNKTRRHVDQWLPIHGWTLEQVWADIRASGVRHHWAYDLGMTRLSCVFCVLASERDLVLAAQVNPKGAAKRLAAERRMAARKILLAIALTGMVREGIWPCWEAHRQLARAWRADHRFRRGKSIAVIIAKAAATRPARAVKRS